METSKPNRRKPDRIVPHNRFLVHNLAGLKYRVPLKRKSIVRKEMKKNNH